MGQVTLMTDLVVIVLGGFVFGNIDAVLYGVISTYAASVIIDKIIYGAGSGKLAIIITTDGYATAKKIDEETGRGATLIKAIGTYSGIERHLILCACGKAEIFKVRNAAHAVDPNAFVMITEASEVFGEGFTPPELDQLPSRKAYFGCVPCFRRGAAFFVRHGRVPAGGMPPALVTPHKKCRNSSTRFMCG